MKYRKGSKVEVLDRSSPESWRPAKIVSGNGHTYRVMYDDFLPDNLTVPRKDLRPCPPLVMGLKTWHEGDHVEVFEGNSWKAGVVAGKDGGCFSVTILGCSREIIAHGCDVRVRQTWQDGRWIMTDKVDLNSDFRIINNSSKLRGTKKQIKRCEPTSRNMIAISDYGRVQRRKAQAPYPIPEKVDAVVSPQLMLGEKYMHASLNCKATALPVVDMDMKLYAQHNHANITCSVVDSCSVNDPPYLESHDKEVGPSCEWGRSQSLPRLGSPAEEAHWLELSAYRSTILAFHASGPLTWEKESLLTDLRLTLHISNDDHLLELRRLKSANA